MATRKKYSRRSGFDRVRDQFRKEVWAFHISINDAHKMIKISTQVLEQLEGKRRWTEVEWGI